MDSLKLYEASDLEGWLASCKDRLFGRDVLWISRQDRPSHEQRSDIIGVAKNGDLLLAELKRGLVGEEAVTQALGYTAEYQTKTAEELETLFASQSSKIGVNGLVVKADSLEDAKKRLATHLGTEVEINETQVVVLLGEQFTAKALAICNYLNDVVQPDLCVFECWRYSVHVDGEEHFLAIEQLLPPPSARALIEERREESKSRKYARDPVRIKFMHGVIESFANSEFSAQRSKGQSYDCRIVKAGWPRPESVLFSLKETNPTIWVEVVADIADTSDLKLTRDTEVEGYWSYPLMDLQSTNAIYNEDIRKRLEGFFKQISFPPTAS